MNLPVFIIASTLLVSKTFVVYSFQITSLKNTDGEIWLLRYVLSVQNKVPRNAVGANFSFTAAKSVKRRIEKPTRVSVERSPIQLHNMNRLVQPEE